MTNTTDHALTVREMQQLAVSVLDELLSLDLPEVNWYLSHLMSKPELEGQVSHQQVDDDRRADVRRWADALKTDVTERRAFNNRFTTVRAIAEFEGVTVTVWAQVDYTDDEAER